MNVIPRPHPPYFAEVRVPDGLPAPLADLAGEHAEAGRAVAEAREAYLDALPGGSAFLAADGKRMLALLAEEPSRYAAWWTASRKHAESISALLGAITPALVEEADRNRVSILADLEIALTEAGRAEYAGTAEGRLARAEVEMQVEAQRQAYWAAFDVLAFLRSPRQWRGYTGGKGTERHGWPAELSMEAQRGAQVLTGAEWRMVGGLR